MLIACYVTVLAYLCAFESITAFQIRQVVNDSSHDESNGPLQLANAVINTIRSLARGKSGAEAKAAFQEIVQLATNVLEEANAGDQVPKTTSDEAVSNLTAVQATIRLDGELKLLAQYARQLLQDAGESGEGDTLVLVIAILERAEYIVALIGNTAIDYVSYKDPNEASPDVYSSVATDLVPLSSAGGKSGAEVKTVLQEIVKPTSHMLNGSRTLQRIPSKYTAQ